MKKLIISILLAVVMTAAALSVCAKEKQTFTDVPEGAWYHDAVYYCTDNKFFAGITDKTFAPNKGMTRAMFVTVLASQHDFNRDDYKNSSFTDVEAGKWYAVNVEWAYREGLVAGVGNGRFAPDKVITRAQLVTLIRTYAEYLGYDMSAGEGIDMSSYKDAKDVPSWAEAGFRWAVANDIVGGVKSGNDLLLAPDATATRATVALIMMKLNQLTPRFIYKSVVVIGVDGAGSFNTETPNVDRIFKDGARCKKMLVTIPSSSAPSWGTLLTGVEPDVHEFTNDSITSGLFNANEDHPTIFKMVRDEMPDAKLSAFCNWYPIYTGIIENNIGVETGTGNDAEVCEQILDYLDEQQPTLMFVQFDNVDHVGHSEGFNTENYYKAIQTVDGYIGEIYDKIAEKGYADDTLFVVTADHGGYLDSHGGYTDTEKFVFLGVCGKSINSNPSLKLISRDFPSIVAYALGTKDIPDWDCYLPSGLFTDKMVTPARPQGGTGIVPGGETPGNDSANYIGNFLDSSRIRTFLTFDNGVNPEIGGIEAKENGSPSYVDGINGNALRISPDSYVSLPGLKFGNRSFSIASWIRMETLTGDMPFFGNNDWSDEYSKGFALCSGFSMSFNVGNGDALCNDYKHVFSQPYLITEEWMHVLLVVDNDAGKVRFYVDFKPVGEISLDEEIRGISFDGDEGNIFCIGNDGTGSYPDGKLTAEYDDFIVYDGTMSDSDVANLRSYYFERG